MAGGGVLRSALAVYPLDYFIAEPARYMAPTEGALPPLGQEVIDASTAVIAAAAPGITVSPLERFAFYDEARKGFAVVQCVAERRPYGNFILTKGVVGPDGNDLKP
jgi:L-fucose mutarotase